MDSLLFYFSCDLMCFDYSIGVQGKTIATARPYVREPEITMTPVRKKVNLPGCSTSNSVQISKISPSAVKPTAPAAQIKPDVALSKIKDNSKSGERMRSEPQKPMEALRPLSDVQGRVREEERLDEVIPEQEVMEEDRQEDEDKSNPYYCESTKHSGGFDSVVMPHSSVAENRYDDRSKQDHHLIEQPSPSEVQERTVEPMRSVEMSRPFAEVSRNQHQTIEQRPFAEVSRNVDISRVDSSRQFDINRPLERSRSYSELPKTPDSSRSFESRPFAEVSRTVDVSPSRPFDQQRALLDPTRPFAEISSARHNMETSRSYSDSRNMEVSSVSRPVEIDIPRTLEPQRSYEQMRSFDQARNYSDPPPTSRPDSQRGFIDHRVDSRSLFDHNRPIIEPSRPIMDPPRNILEPMKPEDHPRSDPLRSIIDQSRSASDLSRPMTSEPSRPMPDASRNIPQMSDITRQMSDVPRPISDLARSVPDSRSVTDISRTSRPIQEMGRNVTPDVARPLSDIPRPLPPLTDISRAPSELSRPIIPDSSRPLPDFSRPILESRLNDRGDSARPIEHRSDSRSGDRTEMRADSQRNVEPSSSRTADTARPSMDQSTALPLLDAMRSSIDRPVARPEPIRHLDDRNKPELSFAPYHHKEDPSYKPPAGYPPVGYPATYPAYPAYPAVYTSAFHRPEPTPFASYTPYNPLLFPPPPHFQPPPQ